MCHQTVVLRHAQKKKKKKKKKTGALGFWIKFEFRSVGFLGDGKTGILGEKPLGARTRTNNKLNPHMAPSVGTKNEFV